MAKGAKFKEATDRIFDRVFVCMKCGAKKKADNMKVKAKKVKCRKCNSKQLRAIHKDKKA